MLFHTHRETETIDDVFGAIGGRRKYRGYSSITRTICEEIPRVRFPAEHADCQSSRSTA